MERGTIIIESAHVAVALSSDGTVWMTVEEIATIFQVTSAGIERHIKRLFATGELDERKVKTEEIKQRDGKRCIIEYYNLDMIIALSYRIDTPASKAFRRWVADQIISSLINKKVVKIYLCNVGFQTYD
ncbi:lipofamily protein [uncultured Alistipes sp.]|jgi:DNA ligase (NAD+)|uniref:lipofamily protein n=2 Tax=uncultured Alistipes sp. TaxID=538949 RepID=UPI0025990756|nr:lipofamily protein [uncultured Alistipes sp.]